MKRGKKVKCIESPCKKLINGVFIFEDIIDKEKVRKKMKQSTRQGKSNKAPGWFGVFAKQLNGRLDGIENDIHDIKEDVSVLKEKVTVLEKDVSGLKKDVSELKKDVSDIKEDVDNIVKKNNLKR
ncbi:MAG: hypothetical protein Ta2E_04170 [Mycoplasmoidaceae bacterium]|nr:MAG: hypothetical protein Ta2E_04170 [Mycoplasmoidaceae bacterium]